MCNIKKFVKEINIRIMKKIKLLASLLAVGAASTMLATASFATDFTASAGYTAGEGTNPATVAVSGLDNYSADNSVGDYTIVILTEDAETVTDENLVYVNQGTKTDISTAKLSNLTVGSTYYVRIGGASSGYVSAKFTVPGGSTTDPDPKEKVLIGDANGDGSITAADCSEMYKFIGGVANNQITGNTTNLHAAAYASSDNTITAADCSEVYKQVGGVLTSGTDTVVGTKVEIGTYGEVAE